MRLRFVCALVSLLTVLSITSVVAAPPDLGFKPADDEGFYAFNTGVLRGKVRLNGTSQGIIEVVHVPSGQALAAGGRLPGLVSYYRIFSGNTRFGNAARDWPTQAKVLPDGALQVFWPGAEDHPLEITAVYRWTGPGTLDVTTTVKPQKDMPAFEVFLSSYYEKEFLARVYVKPAEQADAAPRFVPVDRTAESKGGYVMFPRDQAARDLTLDGRWKVPPNPVDWDQVCWLAAPLAVRGDKTSGLSAVMMSPPEDCFAIASPYNPATPDGGGYRSLYLSFFGQDLKAGKTAEARYRLVVAQDLSDEQTVKLYEKYVQGQNR